MFAGVGVYLMFHYISWLSPLKVLAGGAEDYILPAMVFIQLKPLIIPSKSSD